MESSHPGSPSKDIPSDNGKKSNVYHDSTSIPIEDKISTENININSSDNHEQSSSKETHQTRPKRKRTFEKNHETRSKKVKVIYNLSIYIFF